MSGVSFVGFDSKDLLKNIVFFSVEIGGLLEEGVFEDEMGVWSEMVV